MPAYLRSYLRTLSRDLCRMRSVACHVQGILKYLEYAGIGREVGE